MKLKYKLKLILKNILLDILDFLHTLLINLIAAIIVLFWFIIIIVAGTVINLELFMK